MRTAATHSTKTPVVPTPTLFLAFEVGKRTWILGFTSGLGQSPRQRKIAARDLAALTNEIAAAKARFDLPTMAAVVSCYEAGRDGFWLHRALLARGIANRVVDSASIEVNRRSRRAKSDRLDVRRLLVLLVREALGERRVWHVVAVPSVAEEDARQLHRELLATRYDRARLTNRIRGLLASQGLVPQSLRALPAQLPRLKLWDGSSLPRALTARLEREWALVTAHTERLRALRTLRRAQLRRRDDPSVAAVRQLLRLRGVGLESAWLYVMEIFAWRTFENRRQVGAIAGLTPTPYQSGDSRRELGISRAGNRYVRALAIELAWSWLRWQPASTLTQWYQRRFARGPARMRRIGIVAVARRLFIALWRYLVADEVPLGAMLKA